MSKHLEILHELMETAMVEARRARAVGFNHVALEVGDIDEASDALSLARRGLRRDYFAARKAPAVFTQAPPNLGPISCALGDLGAWLALPDLGRLPPLVR